MNNLSGFWIEMPKFSNFELLVMLSPKENLLRVLNHEEAEYVPCGVTDQTFSGFLAPFEKGLRR
jgi:hypothetical protein